MSKRKTLFYGFPNKFDDLFQEKCKTLEIQIEVFDRYADDQNVAMRDFGREMKFCPLNWRLIQKLDTEIKEEQSKRNDELVMEKPSKVADTII